MRMNYWSVESLKISFSWIPFVSLVCHTILSDFCFVHFLSLKHILWNMHGLCYEHASCVLLVWVLMLVLLLLMWLVLSVCRLVLFPSLSDSNCMCGIYEWIRSENKWTQFDLFSFFYFNRTWEKAKCVSVRRLIGNSVWESVRIRVYSFAQLFSADEFACGK